MVGVSGIPEMQADLLETADDVVTGTSTGQSLTNSNLIHVTDQNTCYYIGTADTVLDYPSGMLCNVCTKRSASTELYFVSLFFFPRHSVEETRQRRGRPRYSGSIPFRVTRLFLSPELVQQRVIQRIVCKTTIRI